MERVWGGRVISAILADMLCPIPMGSQKQVVTHQICKCAVIEFAKPEVAEMFALQTSSSHPIGTYSRSLAIGNSCPPKSPDSVATDSKDEYLRSVIFPVTSVDTLSYPMSIATRSYIKHGYSRYLQATKFNTAFIMAFLVDIGMHYSQIAEQLLHISIDSDQTLHLHFSTIGRAVLVYELLMTVPKYGYVDSFIKTAPSSPTALASITQNQSMLTMDTPARCRLSVQGSLIWGRDPCDRPAISERSRRFSDVTQDPKFRKFMQRFRETVLRTDPFPKALSLPIIGSNCKVGLENCTVSTLESPPEHAISKDPPESPRSGASFRKKLKRQIQGGWEVVEADHWKELESLAKVPCLESDPPVGHDLIELHGDCKSSSQDESRVTGELGGESVAVFDKQPDIGPSKLWGILP
ncbi:uncharacterized protein BROUX77_003950 [Berkeleyomyces rouxiae]|uniref:uncharacterized protein n=1 Tax=Berkeleyomyces rouxiae TaxID=2035830 RepID=UPI003B782455